MLVAARGDAVLIPDRLGRIIGGENEGMAAMKEVQLTYSLTH
jgi:hypothetical protein